MVGGGGEASSGGVVGVFDVVGVEREINRKKREKRRRRRGGGGEGIVLVGGWVMILSCG